VSRPGIEVALEPVGAEYGQRLSCLHALSALMDDGDGEGAGAEADDGHDLGGDFHGRPDPDFPASLSANARWPSVHPVGQVAASVAGTNVMEFGGV
jgi:hypothetical protein